MQVTAREFRSNQGKFLTAARNGQPLTLKSRYGNFTIIPEKNADEDEASLTNSICQGLREVSLIRKGQLKGYTLNEILDEL